MNLLIVFGTTGARDAWYQHQSWMSQQTMRYSFTRAEFENVKDGSRFVTRVVQSLDDAQRLRGMRFDMVHEHESFSRGLVDRRSQWTEFVRTELLSRS